MLDKCYLSIKCPKCGCNLEMSYYHSRGYCDTWRRIACTSPICDVDTGQQSSLSDVYQALLVKYYGAISSNNYCKPKNDVSLFESNDLQLMFDV